MTEALGLELRRPPSDSSFHYFFFQVDVAALRAVIYDWTMAVLKQLLGELDLGGVLIQADALHTQKPFFTNSRSREPTSC